MKINNAISLICLALVFCAFQNDPEWIKFESPEFKFKILIPREPNFITKQINSENGIIKLNMFIDQPSIADKDVNIFYGVNIQDYPRNISKLKKSELNAFFKTAIQESVERANGKLVHEEIIDFNGYPGRDFRALVRDGSVTIRARMIIVKKRLYTIIVITNKEHDFNKSISKFVHSFQLI